MLVLTFQQQLELTRFCKIKLRIDSDLSLFLCASYVETHPRVSDRLRVDGMCFAESSLFAKLSLVSLSSEARNKSMTNYYIIYVCIYQIDIKLIVAISSIIHTGIMLIRIILIIKLRIYGSYYTIISHGFISLFL